MESRESGEFRGIWGRIHRAVLGRNCREHPGRFQLQIQYVERCPMAEPQGKANEKFTKSDRILKRETFRRTYDGGKKYQAKYFTAFVIPNRQESSRLGITVTRKTCKAVERNRTRRLVREVYRKNKWRVPPGVDIVINVKASLTAAGYDDLEGDFVEFLKRAK